MKYNFDELIDRRNTGAIKIELCEKIFGTADVLPLWVADMDFRTPQFILDAVNERCNHPILGYSMPCEDYFKSILNWIEYLHHWKVERDWLGFLPGIVPGLAFAVNAFTQYNDEIIIQPPVYPPFMNVPSKNHRKIVYNPLKVVDGRFEMDFDDLERKITGRTRLFILCNPHNPGGRAWDEETLKHLAEICYKHGILVVSDEIHSDMALPDNKHIPFASVSELAEQNSVTYMAPSKTFNMAGLISSSYIIPNKETRKNFSEFLENSELANGNIFAYVAAKAAYSNGKEWLGEMLQYVQGNVDYVIDFLKNNVPQIKPMIPQASFLIWLDCSGMNMSTNELQDFMVHKAGLGLNKGTTFGPGGEQHLRLNVGCPRSILVEAMEKLKKAVDKYK
ncbi:Cystathionine beta-lyase PatB [uncultured Paludibacter sp.]|uniref:cysteine-S-conjugate beta-lyase n=1 Tax=uncultured Paludibacter sp. TaxID=497635 RepID=A0A653A6L3_9BACT|nr:Cystathionine beta-lyase PatB [uncultured Paludibacter sp.]